MEAPDFSIFSRLSNVHGRLQTWVGRFRSFLPYLTFFLLFYLSRFSFYIKLENILEYSWITSCNLSHLHTNKTLIYQGTFWGDQGKLMMGGMTSQKCSFINKMILLWIVYSFWSRNVMSQLLGILKKLLEEKEETYWKNEEISGWKAHINTRKLNWNISTITDVFLDQKRVNVCEHMIKTAPYAY